MKPRQNSVMGEINSSKPGDNKCQQRVLEKLKLISVPQRVFRLDGNFDSKQSAGQSVTHDRQCDINIGWNVRQSAKFYDSNGRPDKTWIHELSSEFNTNVDLSQIPE
jgi:hypothetical protein